ncbi:MAG: MotA/TolQ/ExbB proton channel family protein [Bdellovibrionaceae bacterium]|nr:MotA/TolQ/ExbB proton channel family protein [Pseudobdellovibrionaceae bacterium]
MDFTNAFFNISKWGHEFTLYLLILLSITSIAFILERWFFLKKILAKSKIAQTNIDSIIQTGELKELENLAYDKSSLEGEITSYTLKHIKRNSQKGISELFSAFIMGKKQSLDKRLSFLASVGSNAPFIGLLGTVFGIMDAFKELAKSQGDASGVMLGISKALLATAVGLIVAIPAVVAFNFFKTRVSEICNNLTSLQDLFIAYGHNYEKLQDKQS